jgi:hypothetical protein
MLVAEPIEDKLAQDIWEDWQQKNQTRYWKYFEITGLTKQFIKMCREQQRDYREFDITKTLDSHLTYEENQALINKLFFGDQNILSEQEAFNELNEKLAEDYGLTVTKSLKPTSELEQTNKELQKEKTLLKETLLLTQKQKEEITAELIKLKNQVIAEHKQPAAPTVQIKPELTLTVKPKKHILKATKFLLSDVYWAFFKL